jgi:hypothetical protein
MDESKLNSYSEALQADDHELAQELAKYDLDASLINEYDTLDERVQALKICYQSLLNSRRFLNA